uniref:GRN-41 n=1 Tax=Oreochromis mossambicus TaxID=8127 RepID=A0A218KL40_OREMO|nr:GRN-41 [Oreochromis mossambicus]AOV87012.1 GRN-41 [Oreochromis mossambicus]
MLRITLCLSFGVFLWGFASCSITCPDGSTCSDTATCCKAKIGFGCCPFPHVSQKLSASAVT